MSSVAPAPTETLRQLERVLGNRLFGRTEQLSRFLRFLVQQHLEGRDHELKETVIGVEVFGRSPEYDPKTDPIVRTEARRLRKRLDEYYAGDGKNDALVIEIPKGGYAPAIRRAERTVGKPARRYWIAAALTCLTITLVLAGWNRWKSARAQTKLSGNPEVNDIYSRARAFELQPNTRGVEESINLFEQAIARDPSFAPAYAGIAAGEAARSAFDRLSVGERAAAIAKGWAQATKAIQMDGLLADGQDALGMMQARQAQWAAADRSFRRAIELAPRDPLWRNHFAVFLLLPLGRIDEAITQLHRAEEIDPLLPATHAGLSQALRSAGRFDESDDHCQKAAANDQDRGACWAQTLLRQGSGEQAVRILETTWSGHLLDPGAQVLGVAYAKAGRRKDAERVAALVPRLMSKAFIFAALGDKDRTFEALDRMVPWGPTRLGRDVLISPNFEFLRGDPRLKALREKVGLPD
jgi:tetratricopeptide (TPR) repeat protein